MRATIIAIGKVKRGRMRFRSGYRTIILAVEDGEVALTTISLDNHAWIPLRLGQTFSGARLLGVHHDKRKTRFVDDDSPVVPVDGPPCQLIKKPRMKQAELFEL